MSGQDKKINVSVDDSGVSKLRQSANELAKDMIRSSRAYSTSSKEVLKDLEDQIKAIEKRNKLEEEGRRISIERARQSGKLTPTEATAALRGSVTEGREDKMQTQLLRELIDTIKSTAKEEIRENRASVEEEIRKDKRTTQLNPEGDPVEILKKTIQREELGNVQKEETKERDRLAKYGGTLGEGARKIDKAAGVVASSDNAFAMGAAAISVLSVGAGMLANRLIGSADRYEKSLGGLSSLRGTNINTEEEAMASLSNSYKYTSLGLTGSQVGEKMYAYNKASGNRMTRETSMQLMAMERTRDIDQATATQLASIQRYDNRLGFRETDRLVFDKNLARNSAEREAGKAGVNDATYVNNQDILNKAEKEQRALARIGLAQTPEQEAEARKNKAEENSATISVGEKYNTGIERAIEILANSSKENGKTNNAILKEYLGTFTSVSNQILAKSGQIDMAETAASISGLASSTKTSGLQMGRVVSGVMGLGESQNPVMKTLMYQSYRKNNPMASNYDIQAAMENPLAKQNLQSTQDAVNRIKTMTGGNGEAFQQSLFSVFENKLSRTDIKEIYERGGDLSNFASDAKSAGKAQPTDQLTKEMIEGKVGNVQISSAALESIGEKVGKAVVDFAAEKFEEVAKMMGVNVENAVRAGMKERW